jgi:hypothetical protein
LFAYVGIFGGAAGENAIGKALADPAKTNKDYKPGAARTTPSSTPAGRSTAC